MFAYPCAPLVAAHQTERVDTPAVARHGRREQAEEGDAVVVAPHDRAPVDAASRDVEEAVGEVGTADARHEPPYAADAASRPSTCVSSHLPAPLGTPAWPGGPGPRVRPSWV